MANSAVNTAILHELIRESNTCDGGYGRRGWFSEKIILDAIHIQHKIHTLREQKVILDFDLALLYGVQTKRLKESVRRNIERFPLISCLS